MNLYSHTFTLFLGVVAMWFVSCGVGLMPAAALPGDDDDGGDAGPLSEQATFSPATAARGALLTITGSGFVSGMTITLGDTPCTSVNVRSSTEATCLAGRHSGGIVDAIFTTPTGESVTIPAPFTYRSYLYVTTSTKVRAYSLDGTSGRASEIPGSPFSSEATPKYATVDPLGKFLFVLDESSGRLIVYVIDNATGALSQVSGSPFALGLTSKPFAIHPDGTRLFSSYVTGIEFAIKTYSINRDTGAVGLSATKDVDSRTGPILVNPDGRHLYAGIASSSDVKTFFGFAINGSQLSAASEYGAETDNVLAIDYEPKEDLYAVARVGTSHSLALFSRNATTGALTEESFLPPGQSGGFALAFHPTQRLIYTVHKDTDRGTQFTWNATTKELTAFGIPFNTSDDPRAILFDPGGNFAYIANNSGDVDIFQFRASDGALIPMTSVGTDDVMSIAID